MVKIKAKDSGSVVEKTKEDAERIIKHSPHLWAYVKEKATTKKKED